MSEKHATKSLKLTIAIFTGLVLGILMGFLMPGRMEWAVPVLDLVSGIYMNALRMMIYPLVFCSLIVGIQGIGSISATGRIGGQCILYYVCTTLLASLLGLFLPKALRLGQGIQIEMTETSVEATQFTSLLDTVKGLIPSNPIASFAARVWRSGKIPRRMWYRSFLYSRAYCSTDCFWNLLQLCHTADQQALRR